MSITHTVQLSASYKENKIEGGGKGRVEGSCCWKFNLKPDGGMDEWQEWKRGMVLTGFDLVLTACHEEED